MSRIVNPTEGINEAASYLHAGQLVAFPTETVYGLGADASNPVAIKAIYEAKERPQWHPLIVHIASAEQLDDWATDIPSYTKLLVDTFWPGPLTLVLPRNIDVPDAVTGSLDTVALRVPSHPVAQSLLRAFGGGIAAPSANKFGHVSSTTAQHVVEEFPDDDILVLDGGPSEIGLESTIAQVKESAILILRPGKISQDELAQCSGISVRSAPAETVPIAPGMLASHYAPRAQILLADKNSASQACLDQLEKNKTVAFIGKEQQADLPTGVTTLTHETENVTVFAQLLYDRLRTADRHEIDVVVIVPPAQTSDGLSSAIWDRLHKASAPHK